MVTFEELEAVCRFTLVVNGRAHVLWSMLDVPVLLAYLRAQGEDV